MMGKYVLFLIVLALFAAMPIFADDNGQTINFFIKENTRWLNAAKVSSKKYGLSFSTLESPGEMWYNGSSGKAEVYTWHSKPIPVGDCERLIIEYNAVPGTYFTVDTYWDTLPKVQLRPISYAVGNGEWNQISIPVRGKAISISCSISSKGEEKNDGLKKVFIRPLHAKEFSSVKVNQAWLKIPLIIPEPKECRFSGQTIELVKDGKAAFGICLNSNNLPLKKIIASEISEACGIDEKTMKVGASPEDLTDCNTVIDLRLNENIIKVPDKKEGYAIECKSKNGKNTIIIAANDNSGLYWAWQTLWQLIHKKGAVVFVSSCDVNDWPDKQFRCLGGNDVHTVKFLAAMKINAMNYHWWVANSILKNANGDSKYKSIIRELCEYAIIRGIDIVEEPAPFFQKTPITVSDDEQIEHLFKTYETSLKLGSRSIILCIDDGGRREKSFTEADKKAYANDVLLSHAWFFKKMSDRIFREYPEALIICITKNYESTKGIDGYYNRIGVSPKVVIMWTGVQCVTFNYPPSVIEQYEKGIEGRRYVMHDNTPGQCFGMYRGLQICEKHGEGYADLSRREKYLGTRPYGAGNATQMSTVKALQIAEQLWNASRYDAEKARQRAIAKVAGSTEAVEPIIRFSEEYLKIALKYPIDKRLSKERLKTAVVGKHQLEDKELTRYTVDDEEYTKLNRKIGWVGDLLKQIEQTCRNPQMTAEFNTFYQNMNEVIAYLHKNNKPLPQVKPEGAFVFNMNDVPGGTRYEKRNNGKVSCAIYGQQTPTSMLEASFEMENIPARDAVLTIEGQDCDKNIATIRVEINGNKIYEGKTQFVQNGWQTKDFSVPAKYFQNGRNVIKITNTCESSDFIDHWVLITEIAIKFK